MKFDIKHTRAMQGHAISIAIETEPAEAIQSVDTDLDDFPLAEDVLDPPAASYQREFAGAGDAGPQMDHNLTVTARTSSGRTQTATVRWIDPI